MPKSDKCLVGDDMLTVGEAIELREVGVTFHCIECEEQVIPHKEGHTKAAAHFEHRHRNPECSLSSKG